VYFRDTLAQRARKGEESINKQCSHETAEAGWGCGQAR